MSGIAAAIRLQELGPKVKITVSPMLMTLGEAGES